MSKRAGNVAFAVIAALFAFLHLYRLGSISPTWDEGTDLGIVNCLVTTHDPFACLDDISQTRLPHFIHALAVMIRPRMSTQYVVSFLASALTLLLLYGFARREFGVAVATLTAALYVTSPQLLASGRMLMTHANILFTLFTTITFLTLYEFLKSGRRAWFFASAIAFGLATSCSILGVFNGIFVALFYGGRALGVGSRKTDLRHPTPNSQLPDLRHPTPHPLLPILYVPIAIATFFATSIIYLKPALLLALIRACTLGEIYSYWNYLGLGSPYAPWYFSFVLFVIKIGPWWLLLAAVSWIAARRTPRSLQRTFLITFAVALLLNFILKSCVFRYDAPHHQVHFYPIVYLGIAAACVGFGRRISPALMMGIALCFAIQLFEVWRFFPNYLFYGSQYGDRFIGEFYGPAVMHAQDRGPVNAYLDAILAGNPNVKILVADHNALERPEPNLVPFTKRDPSQRYDYAFVDRLYGVHFNFPEKDAYNRFLAANYVDDYTYDFPPYVWMYRVMRKR